MAENGGDGKGDGDDGQANNTHVDFLTGGLDAFGVAARGDVLKAGGDKIEEGKYAGGDGNKLDDVADKTGETGASCVNISIARSAAVDLAKRVGDFSKDLVDHGLGSTCG